MRASAVALLTAVAAAAAPVGAGGSLYAQLGSPSGSCEHQDRSHSLPIGTTLGLVSTKGVVRARSVVDVNEIDGPPESHAAKSATWLTYPLIGWVYLDDNGGRWFQRAPHEDWSARTVEHVNAYFGLSLRDDFGLVPVYVVKKLASDPKTDELSVIKCWSRGRALVPGTVTL